MALALLKENWYIGMFLDIRRFNFL